MRKRYAVLLTVIGIAAIAQAKTLPGVEAYFARLPENSVFLEGKSTELLEHIHRGQGIVDTKNGYLLLRGDGAQVSLQVALFRYNDGRPLLAVSYGLLEEADFTQLAFFVEQNGKMVPTNSIDFPSQMDGKHVYELPRHGRVIKVRDAAGKLVAQARFNGERFLREEPIANVSGADAADPMGDTTAAGAEETVQLGRVEAIGKISREKEGGSALSTYILHLEKPLKSRDGKVLENITEVRLVPGNKAHADELATTPEKILRNSRFIFLGTLKKDAHSKEPRRFSLTLIKFKPLDL
ncbi:MAG: hypothetical protein M3Q86_11135 [Verrucomicrobiota bacterium]|nr:hypothetical protein [Verrucomicrobiota bacterium]